LENICLSFSFFFLVFLSPSSDKFYCVKAFLLFFDFKMTIFFFFLNKGPLFFFLYQGRKISFSGSFFCLRDSFVLELLPSFRLASLSPPVFSSFFLGIWYFFPRFGEKALPSPLARPWTETFFSSFPLRFLGTIFFLHHLLHLPVFSCDSPFIFMVIGIPSRSVLFLSLFHFFFPLELFILCDAGATLLTAFFSFVDTSFLRFGFGLVVFFLSNGWRLPPR